MTTPTPTETPYDQAFADQIDAEVTTHCPRPSHRPEADEDQLRHVSPEWFAGWDAATDVAARLVAERQAAVVSDVADAIYHMAAGDLDREAAEYCAAAAIKALGAWPQVPEGWQVDHITGYGDSYIARVFGPGEFDDHEGEGETWQEALQAAIDAIGKEGAA